MSIEAMLRQLVQEGRLCQVNPILGGHQTRLVYAPPDVEKELDPDAVSLVDKQGAGQLRAWIDGFTNGRRVTVGSDKNRTADIKILNPKTDEVWELRKRDSPSTRVFGRFAIKDVFVATNICTSHELFSLEWVSAGRVRWPVWRREIRRCKATWRNLFATYKPISGSQLDDYISNAVDERY